MTGFDPARFVAAREDKGWDVLELSIQTGVGTSTIYHWERGSRRPQLPILRKVASKLGVRLDELIVVPENERTISYYRNIAGLTQVECATRAGMPSSTLAAIEGGRVTRLTEDAAPKLAAALGIPEELVVAAFARVRRPGGNRPT